MVEAEVESNGIAEIEDQTAAQVQAFADMNRFDAQMRTSK